MAAFDPYYVWLGIPPKHQPPDHYRLLGLERFEADPRVIESAADRQMAHVKTFQTGKNSADSQRMLNQLAQARNCLLSGEDKTAYDRTLREQLAVAAPVVPAAPLPVARSISPRPSPSPPFTPPAAPIISVSRRRAAAKLSPVVVAVAAIGILALVGLGIVFVLIPLLREPEGPIVQTAPSPKPLPNKSLSAGPGPQPAKPATPTKIAPSPPKTGSSSSPKTEILSPPPATGEEAPPPQTPAKFATPPSEPPIPAGPPISILERIPSLPLMAGGNASGRWEMVDGKLQGKDGGVMLPVDVPPDYQLDLTVEALTNEGFFVLGIVVAGRQTAVVINWQAGDSRATGFHLLDGRGADVNESTHRGPIFHSGRPCQLRCIVRGNYVQLTADAKTVIQWRGDPARLVVSHDWAVPDRKSLFISSSWDFRISRIELTPFSSPPPPPKPQPKFALAPARRLPLPAGKELQQARVAARKLFVKEFAGINSVTARRELAQLLLARAKEDREEVAVRYALLLEAHDLARNALDADTACQAIQQQSRAFELDALALQTAVIEGVTKESSASVPPVELRATAATASIYLDKTLLAERLELATRLATALRKLAALERSAEMKEHALRRSGEVAFAKQLFDAMKPLSSEIGEDAKSEAANLAVGRYECFVRGNWPEGLLLLSRGSDKPLAEVAALELGADIRKYRAVADAWWKLAESAAEPWRTEYRQQAKYWYERVSAELSGLERHGKIDGVKGLASNRHAPGLVGAYYQGDNRDVLRVTRIEKQVHFPWGWGNGSPDLSIPGDRFSAVWSGYIQAPVPGKYRLVVDSDDGSLLRLDGQALWDEFGGGAGVRSAVADLTGEPQRLEVHYHEGGGTTHCVLRWGMADATGDRVVGEASLWHDPLAAREMRAKQVCGYYPDMVGVPSAPEGGLLAILEDQIEFPTILTEGAGTGTIEEEDRYSGNIAMRIVSDQRFRTGIPGLQARVREKPGPGEYRYLRLAWKKVGGETIGLQILTQSLPGATPNFFEWKRYHMGTGDSLFGGPSIRLGEELPTQWSVITRDLFADYGEFDLTGVALSPCDGVYGLFDHLYLARRLEDFERLGAPLAVDSRAFP